jgi:hypothetical protein
VQVARNNLEDQLHTLVAQEFGTVCNSLYHTAWVTSQRNMHTHCTQRSLPTIISGKTSPLGVRGIRSQFARYSVWRLSARSSRAPA